MLLRPRLLRCLMFSVLSAPGVASGQIIFSDSDFLASSYTTSGAGTQDIRFNLDYSSIDIFGDGFLNVVLPASPRGGGTTTGVFLSANNNSFLSSAAAFSSISPVGVNVGTGTANPNYVMRVDVFHSTGVGIDDGSGTISQRGSTNHMYLGVNQSNSTVQIRNLNAPGATGSLSGQGIGLAITADSGDTEDYWQIVGGATYLDRSLTDIAGQAYSQSSGAVTGLISRTLNDYWVTQGFEFDVVTPEVNDNLSRTTGNHSFFAPDPTNLAGFLSNGTGVDRSLFLEAFPKHNKPLHYSGGGVNPPSFLAPNDNAIVPGGVPYNSWATHELYWVDGTFTYVINYEGVTLPVMQFTPDADGLGGDDNVFSPFSASGTGVLGFWDRFSTSIALDPDGGNFVIYDNLEFEVATANDVPDPIAYLQTNGFLLTATTPGDFDGDGDADGNDFLEWQRGNSPSGPLDAGDLAAWQGAYPTSLTATTTGVPEPNSILLFLGMTSWGLLGRRKS